MCIPSPGAPASSRASAVTNSSSEITDPMVSALNTLMFGLLVHFGTIWFIEQYISQKESVNQSASKCTSYGSMPFVLLLHEYWVYLQHTNVLSNPHLQHLDRQYGIALLKNNQHWAIAGTLSSYWCRETIGMFLTLPFLQIVHQSTNHDESYVFSKTQYMILYSLIYHTIKSRGVRSDAIKRCSDKFGIMRIVIDRFYVDTFDEFLVSVGRLFLQGMDTYIHFCIVRDMILLLSIGAAIQSMHILFIVWVIHAALNQLFRRSTATVIVQCWDALTAKASKGSKPDLLDKSLTARTLEQINQNNKAVDLERKASIIRTESLSSTCSSSEPDLVATASCNNEKYIVRQLLHHERVPSYMRGRDGSASNCVDKAVRIETAITIVSSVFMVGLGRVPFEALTTIQHSWVDPLSSGFDVKQIQSAALFSWLFWGVFQGIWSFFLRSRRQNEGDRRSRRKLIQPVVNLLDMMVTIAIQSIWLPQNAKVWILCAVIVVKSILQDQRQSSPKLLRMLILVTEFLAKLSLLRILLTSTSDHNIALVASLLTLFWLSWVISNPISTPCEEVNESNHEVADAVFLGHPANLSDFWALWLLPYSLDDRWRPPFWSWLLWPIHFVVGIYTCKYRRLFGDSNSYICCDDVSYGQTRMQNWVIPHFGRHFVTNKSDVKHNIEAAARHAEKVGVKVLCLGALNKAESINGGGVSLVKHLGPHRKLSVIHGNHLTAAAVVETIHQCFRDRNTNFFLTGASSKVGWAVAQALKKSGYGVLCHSTDKGRRDFFEDNGFASASTLTAGAACPYWIVGKYDTQVAKEIPQNAVAVVFSVPHPLDGRQDVRVIEAGTLHIDSNRLDRPRQFTNKLKAHEIFACHAASAVAAHRLRTGRATRIDEVGPVDIEEINSWLVDARLLGFSVPLYEPVTPCSTHLQHSPTVVVVGSGPAGLCAAAGLSIRNIPFVVLDAEIDANTFGSWNILSRVGANVTTQKKWCNLTGYEMNDEDFPGEYVSPVDYQRYLKQYANRFSITSRIRRGAKVVSIDNTGSEVEPWKVVVENGLNDIVASSVIIATGKHRIPCVNTSDDLVSKLRGIPYAHSTEMTPDNWKLAFDAATVGALCIVGLGNSSSDIASAVLQNCRPKGNNTTMIHIAARSVPPVFPQRMTFLRADTFGYVLGWLPLFIQEFILRLLWQLIPSSRQCNSAFPSHLKRWRKVNGRIPVIDKGYISAGLASGQVQGHGPILDVNQDGVIFSDSSHALMSGQRIKIDMIILATGYKEECIVDREEPHNGLYKLGFGNDNFLPLHSMTKEAKMIVDDIAAVYKADQII